MVFRRVVFVEILNDSNFWELVMAIYEFNEMRIEAVG
jgi:hypothetical protein